MTLTEIVRFTPGVQVRDNGGPGPARPRSAFAACARTRAAVLVDGVRFRDAATDAGRRRRRSCRTSNFVDADRVEVLRGSASRSTAPTPSAASSTSSPVEGGPQRSEGQFEVGSLGQSRARGTTGGGALGGRSSIGRRPDWLDVRDGARRRRLRRAAPARRAASGLQLDAGHQPRRAASTDRAIACSTNT